MTFHEPYSPPRFLSGLLWVSLRFYPREFRDSWSEEMEETFFRRAADVVMDRSTKGLLQFSVREFWAMFRAGIRLRMEGVSLLGSGHNPGPIRGDHERGIRCLAGVPADLKVAARGLGKAPGFTVAAILVLALGIGINATAFSVVKMAVLAPPPFPEAHRVVMVDMLRKDGEEDAGRSGRWPYPMLLAVEELENRFIEPLAGFDDGTVTLTGMGPATEIGMEIVSPGYFEVIGIPFPLGRGFTADEAEEGGPFRVAVVSYSFWRGRLGGDSSALGRVLELSGESFEIVGVAPQGFAGLGGDAELWLPLGATAVFRPGRRAQDFNHQIWVVGRLRPDATIEAARDQMGVIAEGLSDRWPGSRYGMSARSLPEVWVNPRAETSAKLLAIAAAMVLLVACANLSGLLITRARRRVRDGAVRMALGAARWRLIRLYLVESLVLSTLGGILGIGLAFLGNRGLSSAWPDGFLNGAGLGLRVNDPRNLALDGTVLGFAFLIVFLTAVLVGMAPALRVSKGDFARDLKEGTGATRSGKRVWGLDTRATLVGGQVSLALILLIGSGLVSKSLRRLMTVDEGFRTERVLTFEYSLSQSTPPIDYVDNSTLPDRITSAADFDDRLIRRLDALPEVEAATVGCGVLQGYCAVVGVMGVDGRRLEEPPSIAVITVHDRYFEVLEIPVLRGRGFTPQDGLSSNPVVVLSASAAETYFPGVNPVGHLMTIEFAVRGREQAEVIGVVGDVLYGPPDATGVPVAYFSTQERRFANHALIRTSVRPNVAVRAIRSEIHAMDPTVAMSGIASAEELVSRSAGDRRIVFGLLGLFAGVSVLLAAIGTWGIVASSVTNQRRELSLRIALGADRRVILGQVARDSATAAFFGLAGGFGGALAGTRLLDTFLWETSAQDPQTYFFGVSFLFVVILAASYFPGRRATRLDPAQALKAE